MPIIDPHASGNTSPYYPFYQTLFEMVDSTSLFWQPMLKAVGRSHLELAGLQARQCQAFVNWAYQVALPSSPAQIVKANVDLWQTLLDQTATSMRPLMGAVESLPAAEVTVLQQHRRDNLILMDRETAPDETDRPRKVA